MERFGFFLVTVGNLCCNGLGILVVKHGDAMAVVARMGSPTLMVPCPQIATSSTKPVARPSWKTQATDLMDHVLKRQTCQTSTSPRRLENAKFGRRVPMNHVRRSSTKLVAYLTNTKERAPRTLPKSAVAFSRRCFFSTYQVQQ